MISNISNAGRFVLALCVLACSLVITETSWAGRLPTTLVTPKDNPVISAAADRILDRVEKDGRVKVWVFFTDKGIIDEPGLAAAIQVHTSKITAKAARRRAKMGLTQATFVDLPVTDYYVRTIRQQGGTLRRVSRWLNAASFEIERTALADVAALPFVRSIRPVIGYKSPRVEHSAPPLYKPTEPGPLDYGPSIGQLAMIGVTSAHTAGYDAAGVLVCMMDTGFRKDHTAFANAFAEGRVWAEYDFIYNDENTQNELEDISGQHNHGTYTWSALGGIAPGNLFGPAYKANFILAKTEDMRSETPVEEDNWVAGMEWADSIGADVISSSLGYTDWYTAPDYDGNTCVTSMAADIAATLGIVVCNSCGNGGPSASTMNSPSDADTVISVGAVNSFGTIVSFSSRGPTYDGRIKPEVCAQGSGTRCATASTTTSFGYVSGTSLSCPLVGGAAALIVQAHPDWTPFEVREAMMQTASTADAPNNTYGWGILDVMDAINSGAVCDCTNHCDLNDDDAINPVDVTLIVNYVYKNLAPPPEILDCPMPNGDWNCDSAANPVDVVRYVNYVYKALAGPCDPCALD